QSTARRPGCRQRYNPPCPSGRKRPARTRTGNAGRRWIDREDSGLNQALSASYSTGFANHIEAATRGKRQVFGLGFVLARQLMGETLRCLSWSQGVPGKPISNPFHPKLNFRIFDDRTFPLFVAPVSHLYSTSMAPVSSDRG